MQARIIIWTICLFTLTLTLSACDSRANESDAEADRNTLIVLGAILQGDYNVRAACLRATQAGLSCAEGTGLPAATAADTYSAISQLVYGSVTLPASITSDSLCDTLIASSTALARATAEARTCLFQCEADYWNADPTNQCTALDYTNTASGFPAGVAGCFASCLQSTPRFYY